MNTETNLCVYEAEHFVICDGKMMILDVKKIEKWNPKLEKITEKIDSSWSRKKRFVILDGLKMTGYTAKKIRLKNIKETWPQALDSKDALSILNVGELQCIIIQKKREHGMHRIWDIGNKNGEKRNDLFFEFSEL